MRSIRYAIAAVGLVVAMPALAHPVTPSSPGTSSDLVQVQMMSRKVVTTRRCRTVVTKRRGPMGRMVVVRKRSCM